MDLRHLQTFRAILREGSFHEAARSLRLAQPTVTLHVQELEDEFGLPLFDREGRRRRPTPAGELLAARGLPLLDSPHPLRESMEDLRDDRAGSLKVGAIEPAASRRVMPLLARLRRRRPGLRVHLDVGGTAGVSRAVSDRSVAPGPCSAP